MISQDQLLGVSTIKKKIRNEIDRINAKYQAVAWSVEIYDYYNEVASYIQIDVRATHGHSTAQHTITFGTADITAALVQDGYIFDPVFWDAIELQVKRELCDKILV